jgi:hypothetical protein
LKPKELSITVVHAGRTELRLVKPLKVKVSEKGGWWSMTNDDLNLIATAPAEKDCRIDLEAEFIFVHNFYGLGEDSQMSKGAQELKRKVLAYVNQTQVTSQPGV